MANRSKRIQQTRTASEFDLARLSGKLYFPRDGQNTIYSWSLEEIQGARDEQMLGQFVRPARLVESMRTDDALAVAFENRLAPQRCIPVEIKAALGARAEGIANEAEGLFGAGGVGTRPGTLADIQGCLVNHGIAFATNVFTPREDGSRVDLELQYYPIEYVRWDPVFRVFKARADPNSVQEGDIPDSPYNEYGFVGGFWIPVIHGDGRWVIFTKHDNLPFRQEAAILPAALVWARHAFSIRDWAMGSRAHGSAKVIGELPQGVPLQAPGGALTAEASAFIELMQAVARSDSPVGIRPSGSKTDFVVNTSTAWQVWKELVLNAEKAAARIYLGTDGTLGASGGAPGVDISQLFGVATTKVRGDLECLSRGINSGCIQPWTAINFGDSRLAPEHRYCIPNPDEDAVTKAYAERQSAFCSALVAYKQAGLKLSPASVWELAEEYRVKVPEFTYETAPATEPAPAVPLRIAK